MKKTYLIMTFALISILSTAQSYKTFQVENAVKRLTALMINPEKDQLEKLVSDNLSYGHSSGVVDNKEQFIQKLVSASSDFVSIDLSEQTITLNRKTAIVRHILKAKTNDGGKAGDVNLRVMLVFQKESGMWVLLARQAVRM